MGVTVSVPRDKDVAAMIDWLQCNVGPMLWAQPTSFWHGQGWHIKLSLSYFATHRTWEVRIDDEQLATAFTLKWA